MTKITRIEATEANDGNKIADVTEGNRCAAQAITRHIWTRESEANSFDEHNKAPTTADYRLRASIPVAW